MTRKGWILFIAMSVIWGIPYLFIKIALLELDSRRCGICPRWDRSTDPHPYRNLSGSITTTAQAMAHASRTCLCADRCDHSS